MAQEPTQKNEQIDPRQSRNERPDQRREDSGRVKPSSETEIKDPSRRDEERSKTEKKSSV